MIRLRLRLAVALALWLFDASQWMRSRAFALADWASVRQPPLKVTVPDPLDRKD